MKVYDPKKRYYLAHQLATKGSFETNVKRLYTVENVLCCKGYRVMNSHNITGHLKLNDRDHRQQIMDICYALVKACDYLVVCSEISMGVAKEIIVAQAHGVEVIQLHDLLPTIEMKRYFQPGKGEFYEQV